MRRIAVLASLATQACTTTLPQQPPTDEFGSIEVAVLSSGQNFPDGYWVALDSAIQGYGLRFYDIGIFGTRNDNKPFLFVPVLLGQHTVALRDIAPNCELEIVKRINDPQFVVSTPEPLVFMDEPSNYRVTFRVTCS